MMNDLIVLPAFILLAGAVLTALLRGHARTAVIVIAPLLALLAIVGMDDNLRLSVGFLSYEVLLVENTDLRKVIGTSFVLVLLAGLLFAFQRASTVELAAAMAYGGSAIGVVFAGDLLMLFLFWEFMVIFSAIIIFSSGTEAARRAGIHYVILQLLGGLLLKVGIEVVSLQTDSVAIRPLLLDNYGAWLILSAVLLNAAAVPLSVWLTQAVPSATPTGSVFLALFTTKTAILVAMLLFAGSAVLIVIGLLMVLYGAVYGLREDNIRKLLSYTLVSQVGFLLCGVGVGTPEALTAVALFAVIHIFTMAVLFMAAANIAESTDTESLTVLSNLAPRMPLTALMMFLGAVATLLLPVTSGLVLAVANSGATSLSLLLLAAAATTALHSGYKLPWRLFRYRGSYAGKAEECHLLGRVVMLYAALPVVILLLVPQALSGYLFMEPVGLLVIEQLAYLVAVLFIASLLGWVFKGQITGPRSISVDFDVVYRGWLLQLWRGFEKVLALAVDSGMKFVNGPLRRIPERWLDYHGPTGPLARTWATGSMLVWVTVILAVLLIGARLISGV